MPTGGVVNASESLDTPAVSAGDCLSVPFIELMRGRTANLDTRVVDCRSKDAATVVVDAEEDCDYCQLAILPNGRRIKFFNIPRIGQCFFAYFADIPGGEGWPNIPVPCHWAPTPWALKKSKDIASKMNVDPAKLRPVTVVVTEVSDNEPRCRDGGHLWYLKQREPDVWLCADVLRVH